MRPVALRLVVAAFGMGVEAFMQPGLTGGLQLRQVAFTCTPQHAYSPSLCKLMNVST
jgi:hypothetical protein